VVDGTVRVVVAVIGAPRVSGGRLVPTPHPVYE
jgi:hypothetical protein